MTTRDVMTGRDADGPFGEFLDTVLVVSYASVVGVAMLTGALEGPARIILVAPLLGFLPGYALVAVLFPGPEPDHATATDLRRRGITWFERCALSVASSLVILVVLGVVLSAARLPLDAPTLVASLLVVVIVGMGIDGGRRIFRPTTDRFTVPTRRWLAELRAAPTPTDSRVDAVLNVALLLAVVLAVSGLAYGLAAPPAGESYTQVTLLDQQGEQLVASNYTTVVAPGEPLNATVLLENEEGRAMSYTVVVMVERIRNGTVLQREELTRTTIDVPDGEQARHRLQARPRMVGDDLRYDILVYHGDPPERPTPANADEHLYLWVDVSATATGTA